MLGIDADFDDLKGGREEIDERPRSKAYLIAFLASPKHRTRGPVVRFEPVAKEGVVLLATEDACAERTRGMDRQRRRAAYFSGVNSDSSATLFVGVFRSNRVGVRDFCVELRESN